MAVNRIAAVRGTQQELIGLCRSLGPDDWSKASRCEGWTVKDVVAHLGAIAHGVFTPWMFKLMAAKSVERSNDADVEVRRSRSAEEVLAEYEKWGRRMATLLSAAQRPPLSKVPFKLGELGVYPMALVASAVAFDTHTHLVHDIAPALGRTVPPAGPETTAVINEWVVAGIPRMNKEALAFMDRPVTITLDGPGGGTWSLVPRPGGGPARIGTGPAEGSAARITAGAGEFAVWATRRKPWREADVKVDGDDGYASRVLDAIDVI